MEQNEKGIFQFDNIFQIQPLCRNDFRFNFHRSTKKTLQPCHTPTTTQKQLPIFAIKPFHSSLV